MVLWAAIFDLKKKCSSQISKVCHTAEILLSQHVQQLNCSCSHYMAHLGILSNSLLSSGVGGGAKHFLDTSLFSNSFFLSVFSLLWLDWMWHVTVVVCFLLMKFWGSKVDIQLFFLHSNIYLMVENSSFTYWHSAFNASSQDKKVLRVFSWKTHRLNVVK